MGAAAGDDAASVGAGRRGCWRAEGGQCWEAGAGGGGDGGRGCQRAAAGRWRRGPAAPSGMPVGTVGTGRRHVLRQLAQLPFRCWGAGGALCRGSVVARLGTALAGWCQRRRRMRAHVRACRWLLLSVACAQRPTCRGGGGQQQCGTRLEASGVWSLSCVRAGCGGEARPGGCGSPRTLLPACLPACQAAGPGCGASGQGGASQWSGVLTSRHAALAPFSGSSPSSPVGLLSAWPAFLPLLVRRCLCVTAGMCVRTSAGRWAGGDTSSGAPGARRPCCSRQPPRGTHDFASCHVRRAGVRCLWLTGTALLLAAGQGLPACGGLHAKARE